MGHGPVVMRAAVGWFPTSGLVWDKQWSRMGGVQGTATVHELMALRLARPGSSIEDRGPRRSSQHKVAVSKDVSHPAREARRSGSATHHDKWRCRHGADPFCSGWDTAAAAKNAGWRPSGSRSRSVTARWLRCGALRRCWPCDRPPSRPGRRRDRPRCGPSDQRLRTPSTCWTLCVPHGTQTLRAAGRPTSCSPSPSTATGSTPPPPCPLRPLPRPQRGAPKTGTLEKYGVWGGTGSGSRRMRQRERSLPPSSGGPRRWRVAARPATSPPAHQRASLPAVHRTLRRARRRRRPSMSGDNRRPNTD